LDRLGWPRRVLTRVTGAQRKVGVADERYRGLLTAHDPYADKYLNSHMISEHIHLQIGSLLFEGIDQIDVTGPFEVFSRLPNSTCRLFATTRLPVRDTKGLRLLADDLLSNGNWVFAAGVTAGIDGALRVAASLRGEKVAQVIQLGMAYAPEPPFQSGTPESAPPCVLAEAQRSGEMLAARRLETAQRVAARLGINEAAGK
jgi:hypothetical protein